MKRNSKKETKLKIENYKKNWLQSSGKKEKCFFFFFGFPKALLEVVVKRGRKRRCLLVY